MTRSFARLGVQALAVVVGLVALGMHGTPPPVPPGPPPPPPPPPLPTSRVEPPRWAWHHWWEINRERFMLDLRQHEDMQLPEQAEVDKLRDEAVLTLSLVLANADEDDWVRSEAAISLGRMGAEGAFGDMLRIVNNREGPLAHASMLGLGLLDLATSEPTLVQIDVDLDSPQDDQAAVVSLGMVSRITDPKVMPGLERYMAGGWGPELATSAATTYGTFADDTMLRDIADLAEQSTSPWVAAPLLECLGRRTPGRRARPSVALLRSVLLDDPQAPVGGLRQLHEWQRERSRYVSAAVDGVNIARRKQGYTDLAAFAKRVEEQVPGWESGAGGPWNAIGFEEIQIANLRASAAIGLGQIDHPAARQALLDALDLRDDGYSDTWKSMAIMALAQSEPVDQPVARERLYAIFSPNDQRGTRKPKSQLDSPLRGFAAIGLGLYCRPVETAQGDADRPQWEKVAEVLAERAADERETDEVRAASIVALGLSARTETLRYLQKLSEMIGADEQLLVGYLFLARGLLGDENILGPARVFLDPAADETDPVSIIAKRAAVLGVGATRSDEAIPVLTTAWDLNYWVNREVILALRVAQAYSVTPVLIDLLKNGKNSFERVFAAQALGTLYNRDTPDRIADRLLVRRNFMMRNRAMEAYYKEANQFFYDYLAPLLGGDWY